MLESIQRVSAADGHLAVQIRYVYKSLISRAQAMAPSRAAEGLRSLSGQEPPMQVGATVGEEPRILCVGPGDWLLVAARSDARSTFDRIEALMVAHDFAAVDLSHGFSVVEITGSAVRELLSKGCALDFHPTRFAAGQCARTRFAQMPVVIDCLDIEGRFELYVARSYAPYLNSWLADAATEFEATSD